MKRRKNKRHENKYKRFNRQSSMQVEWDLMCNAIVASAMHKKSSEFVLKFPSCPLKVVNISQIHSLLSHLQGTVPSLEAYSRCENAKSPGSRITSVRVESAELLENYRTNSHGEKETTSAEFVVEEKICPRQQQVVNVSLMTRFHLFSLAQLSRSVIPHGRQRC